MRVTMREKYDLTELERPAALAVFYGLDVYLGKAKPPEEDPDIGRAGFMLREELRKLLWP